MQLARELRSQARTAWIVRGLWSLPQLIRAAQLPHAWYIRKDGTAPPPIAACQYITYACPETCTFCNVTHAVESWQQPLDEADQARLIERIIPTIPTIAIGGGEPMAHPTILEHYARIKRRGGSIFTVTSGTSLGPTKARKLAEIGPDVVMFSILGDEASHDVAMGRVGSWRRSVGGLQNLLDRRDPRRTRIIINCPVDFTNAHTIRSVAALGRKMGVDSVRYTWVSFLTETERMAEPHEINYHIVPDATLGSFNPAPIFAEADALAREHRGFVSFHPALSPAERDRWFTAGGGVSRRCQTLWHTLFIRPDGSVVPCGHLFADPVGNLVEDDLETLWNHPRLKAERLSQWGQPFPVCARCCKV